MRNNNEQLVTMSNKFDKKVNCDYCNKPLEAKYRSKRFCDDKCRVYWNRENPKHISNLNKKTEVLEPQKPISIVKSNSKISNVPERLAGESGIDYLIRCEELKNKM